MCAPAEIRTRYFSNACKSEVLPLGRTSLVISAVVAAPDDYDEIISTELDITSKFMNYVKNIY
jgi:hypothetical protein